MRERLRTYTGRRVLLFGHTGFVGGWLALWLHRLGAEVYGFALEPEDIPSLFEATRLDKRLKHVVADVREPQAVIDAFRASRPDMVFHLAAQSRVRRSYRMPIETLATNVMGTAHVLEALRTVPGTRACVVVTSDKCYENHERADGYRETDPLGGYDAYSASKACAEVIASSYRRAFLAGATPPVLVATARAGNIIGGGDWAEERIVPDCVRAITSGEPIRLRYPNAIRPWQHVLDALFGYLLLGAELLDGRAEFAQAWNFGPDAGTSKTVAELVRGLLGAWGESAAVPQIVAPADHAAVETAALRLDSSKARAELGWGIRLAFDEAVEWSAEWYRAFYRERSSAERITLEQIARYEERL